MSAGLDWQLDALAIGGNRFSVTLKNGYNRSIRFITDSGGALLPSTLGMTTDDQAKAWDEVKTWPTVNLGGMNLTQANAAVHAWLRIIHGIGKETENG